MVEHNRLCERFAVTKISEVIYFQQKLAIPEDSDYWQCHKVETETGISSAERELMWSTPNTIGTNNSNQPYRQY